MVPPLRIVGFHGEGKVTPGLEGATDHGKSKAMSTIVCATSTGGDTRCPRAAHASSRHTCVRRTRRSAPRNARSRRRSREPGTKPVGEPDAGDGSMSGERKRNDGKSKLPQVTAPLLDSTASTRWTICRHNSTEDSQDHPRRPQEQCGCRSGPENWPVQSTNATRLLHHQRPREVRA
jgi:hypothetical protein